MNWHADKDFNEVSCQHISQVISQMTPLVGVHMKSGSQHLSLQIRGTAEFSVL